MIGLGSNRLTVCRRGGMSVTQAGRGGMEWLAGNGKRRESPYSAQATAALKDAYPDLWTTLRDFGFRNPDKVPFINQYPLVAPYLLADGLAFMVDCQYECSAALWKDLIGEVEFAGTNVSLTDGVPTFGGSAYYQGEEIYHDPDNTTIEVVFYNQVSSGWKALYFENSKSSSRIKRAVGFERDNGEYIAFGCGTANRNNPTFTIPLNDLVRLSISGTNILAVQNGVKSTSTRSDYFGKNDLANTFIGTRDKSGYNFVGKIYAIRIYNRLLTEQEILANQAIDLQRWQAS